MNTLPKPLKDPLQRIMARVMGEQVVLKEGWLISSTQSQREQGWKLHISATVVSAVTVLEQVLPVLKRVGVPFKVAADINCLSDLNQGAVGLSQVGKFITIYPDDDLQAVQLAVELDRVTIGLPGPRIPSDQPLHPYSLVHYRYGGFGDLQITDSLGQTLPAIRDSTGNLVPDMRVPRFEPPAWDIDPFEAAGVVQHAPEPTSPLFADSYLILSVLHQNAKGGVYLALDSTVSPPRVCALKEGRRHSVTDPSGRDTCNRLRHQYHILQDLASTQAFPTVYNLFEFQGNLYLVMEYIEGKTLEALVTSRQRVGEQVPAQEVAAIGAAIASTVSQLHELGWILRDLTPTNVIVTADNRVYLIDLELAHLVDDSTSAYGWGTPSYVSPQQAKNRPPTVLDDIYAFGATLHFLATGSDPGFVVGGANAHRRALNLLNPSLPPILVDVIAGCMDPEPANRPPHMTAVSSSIAGFTWQPLELTEATLLPAKQSDARCHHFLGLACSLGELLLATAERRPNGLCWASTATTNQPDIGASYLPRRRFYPPYLHTGTAGTALFLADLGSITGDKRYTTASEEAGQWLLSYCDSHHDMLPGLHFGEAGIAAFFCRLAEVTGKACYLDRACAIASRLSSAHTEIPDLTHGWAGIGLLHLLLATTDNTKQHLEHACAIGNILATQAEPVGPGLGWRHPPGPHSGLSGEILTGLAHGAAGIGYFLFELWHATGETRYYKLAISACRWLSSCAEPCLVDSTGCNWPLAEGRTDDFSRWFYWCHGVAGIGLFFLRAWTLTSDPEYWDLAVAATRTIARAGRRGGGTLCHGLPGNGNMLVEAYQVLQDLTWLNSAFAFGDLLDLYRRPQETGIAWPAENPSIITPDYMVGYAGTAAFFLRLAAPDHRRHSLRLPIS